MSLQNEMEMRTSLNQLCLKAERLMSLRSTNCVDALESVALQIDSDFQTIADDLKSDDPVDHEAIDFLTKEKTEFDTRLSEWFKARQPLSEPDNFQNSAHNRYTSSLVGASEAGSSTSSRSSSKRREAIIKLKLAELEAQQTAERTKEDSLRAQRKVQEDSLRAQREVERKVERATLELKLWDEEVNRTNDENIRYDVTKPLKFHHTNQQSGSALVQGSEHAKNLPKTFTSTPAPITAPRVRFDENVYYNIPSSNRPTPLYDVNNASSSSTYVSSSVINNALSQGGYRPPASLQPHGMPGDYYPANFPESFVPVSNPQVCAPHRHVTPCVFHKDDLCLPRPEFVKFDGNPLNFMTFKTNFEKHVKPKVRDSEMLFCYLLQHCESNVKEKLNHFSNKGSESYALAMGRLEREYGRPCIIVDACEQRLRTAKAVKPDDPESLKCFSDLLEKTKITLEGIGYFGSLNTLDVMTQLINKLPFDFWRIWVKESVAVKAQSGQIADFSHFVSFVVKLSEEANSLYGRRVFGTLSRARPEAHSSSTSRSGDRRKSALSSYNVNVSRTQNPQQSDHLACFFCKSPSHRLLECPEFKATPLAKRSSLVKGLKLCYKCLSPNHRAPSCSKQNTCSAVGCTGTFHHTLLHPWKQRSTPSSTNTSDSLCPSISNSASSQAESSSSTVCSLSGVYKCNGKSLQNVYLCVVPVNVTFKTKSVITYAFLDQGSTHSFCGKALVNALDLRGDANEFTLQTLTGTKAHSGINVSLSVSSLNGDENFVLPAVYSVSEVPILPNPVASKFDLDRFSHLKDLSFPHIPGATVTLLIGADNPEIFCTRDVRVGCKGQPIAIETPLGWSLLGPSLSLSTTNKPC